MGLAEKTGSTGGRAVAAPNGKAPAGKYCSIVSVLTSPVETAWAIFSPSS
jgi:hypothetical protein